MEQIELLTLAARNGEVIGLSVARKMAEKIRALAIQPGAVDRQALLNIADDLPTLESLDTA